ncbi:MAG: RluA family pseudouridine synthase [Alphaproteobacteria bacterium]|nr:RluA family pseudouridine synthase [Alphaproteobacteria bacterium]
MNKTDNNIYFSRTATEKDAGMRLDKFLSLELPDFSRSMLQKLVLSGNVSLDENVISENDFRVRVGDSFCVVVPQPEEADPQPENIPLDIVYEDNDLIVVNKPAGMTVHPASGAWNGTLVNALLFHCKDNLSGIGGVKRPGIVHRIDKDTSGLLVVAKNDLAHKKLSEQFVKHSIERTYYAVVYGQPNPLNGTIEGNIARSKFDRKKMALVKEGGKTAITHYQTLCSYKGIVSLVKCNLETGRTHQIRVHLSSIGCNLVGDKVYEKSGKTQIKGCDFEIKSFINSFPRQALHAASLGFEHPRDGRFLQFEVKIPEDMQEIFERCDLKILPSLKN